MIILATSCQIVPFPPEEIGLVYKPDSVNNMPLASGIIFEKIILKSAIFQNFLHSIQKFLSKWGFQVEAFVTEKEY